MKSILTILLLAGGCSVSTTPPTDLDTWTQLGDIDWQIEGNSAAVGPGENRHYLVSPDTHDDFRLSVEFLTDADTNSGVFIRCADPADINPVGCYEINIWDNHPDQDSRTGSIVTRVKPLVHIASDGKWTRCEIDARGGSVVVRFDGRVTARLEDAELRDGYLALQYGGGGRLQFRGLQIEDLAD